jgi:cation diffusion facilitator CzcD-associated flavoprotein CzcO
LNEHHRVVVIGAGFAGIGLAIRMLREGIDDFVVLERADDVGGTWEANTYPGCQCDIPSHLYSFSFMPNPGWSRTFPEQPEIWDYLRRCAADGGVTPHLRLGCEVTGAEWNGEEALWMLDTPGGGLTASILVAGTGPLSEPAVPDIPGLESFRGAAFHSARWDHDHDLHEERVAVIGTGASAIQIVPNIQPEVGRLHVFQRTPPWVMPHRERAVTRAERLLYRAFPPAQRAFRGFSYALRETMVPALVGDPSRLRRIETIGRAHLRRQVHDPELRARLEPSYRIGCKRILPSNDWYPALQEPNVEVVTDSIAEVRPEGILTDDGVLRELDAIILGTGFNVFDPEFSHRVRGRTGTLADAWNREGSQAYLGTSVSGFPNLFLLLGPNTGLGHNSIVYMIESQLNYVIDALRVVDGRGVSRFEVRPEVQHAFNADLQRRLAGAVWSTGGCSNWYIDDHGRNIAIWPRQTWSFRRLTRRFDPGSYLLEPAAAAASSAARRSTSSGVVSQEHISLTVREGGSQT